MRMPRANQCNANNLRAVTNSGMSFTILVKCAASTLARNESGYAACKRKKRYGNDGAPLEVNGLSGSPSGCARVRTLSKRARRTELASRSANVYCRFPCDEQMDAYISAAPRQMSGGDGPVIAVRSEKI
jgi:hypothetical protein